MIAAWKSVAYLRAWAHRDSAREPGQESIIFVRRAKGIEEHGYEITFQARGKREACTTRQ